ATSCRSSAGPETVTEHSRTVSGRTAAAAKCTSGQSTALKKQENMNRWMFSFFLLYLFRRRLQSSLTASGLCKRRPRRYTARNDARNLEEGLRRMLNLFDSVRGQCGDLDPALLEMHFRRLPTSYFERYSAA